MALETTNKYVSGTFTGSGQQSDELIIRGNMSYSLSGGATATVQLQRSFDEGSTWLAVDEHTANVEKNATEYLYGGVRYRLACTAYTSGTVTYRLERQH